MNSSKFGKGSLEGGVMRTLLGLGFAMLLLITTPLLAQLPTATILGVIRDPSGASVPRAIVTATNIETGLTRTTQTGADGSYSMSALPVGNYSLQVTRSGFRTAIHKGLVLTVSEQAVMNFTLQVGAENQTVTVTTQAPLVNTTSSSVSGLVNSQQVSNLPLNGRNYIDLSLLQPGVALDQNRGTTGGMGSGIWYSSNGASPRSNYYMLDGADMVNMFGATAASVAGTTLGIDAIQEYRVITNSFGAQYGMVTGSQMEITTKGGTNHFHGDVFEYLRNSALDARNYFDYPAAANNFERLPPFKRNNFGGSLGGPIRKNHTFFFLSYEGLRQDLGVTTVSTTIPKADKTDGGLVPTIATVVKPLLTLFPDPNLPNNQFTFPFTQRARVDYGDARVDQVFSSKDTGFVRYTVSDADQVQPRSYPQFLDTLTSRSQFLTLSETHIFTPTFLSTARFSFSRTALNTASVSGISGPDYSFITGWEVGGINIGGVTGFGPDATSPSYHKQNVFTWSDDLDYTKGRNDWKFGILINHFQQGSLDSFLDHGTISFASISSFLLAEPLVYLAPTPGSNTNRYWLYTSYGFYGQDDVHVFSRLILNLGLRYEFYTVPREEQGKQAALRNIATDAATTIGPSFLNPSLHDFGPRLGFAWDVFGNGKTALRGGFGIYYDIANLGSSLVQAGFGTAPFSSLVTVPHPATFTVPFTLPASDIGKTLRLMDYHLKQPRMSEYNLTFEQKMPFNMALSLAYVGSRGYNLIQVTDGNPTVPQIQSNGLPYWDGTNPRVNPNWANITLLTGAGDSWYNSLQVKVTKRVSHGLQFQSAYTWGKSLDDTQGQLPADVSGSGSTYPSYPQNPMLADYGPSSFDVAQNWRLSALYNIPNIRSHFFGAKLLHGWWMGSILAIQTGYPFSPIINANQSQSKVNGSGSGIDRPDWNTSFSGPVITGNPNQWFNPAAFTLQPLGYLGNVGRDSLRGPGMASWDVSFNKNTALPFLGEAGALQFRAEFFNILNHANFGMPNNTVFAGGSNLSQAPLGTAGQINNTSTTSRQIQFALKILF